MTYILNKQQKCLMEKEKLGIPHPSKYEDNLEGEQKWENDCNAYEEYINSLKQYPILPEQWEGYEDGAKVEEFEIIQDCKGVMCFTGLCKECRYATPKQKQVSQSDAKDKRIKELEELLSGCLVIIYYFQKEASWVEYADKTISKAKQALQNK